MAEVKVTCKCGRKAIEVDYENESLLSVACEMFGDIDDLHIFECECGELTSMHYTTYDVVCEELENYGKTELRETKVISVDDFRKMMRGC